MSRPIIFFVFLMLFGLSDTIDSIKIHLFADIPAPMVI